MQTVRERLLNDTATPRASLGGVVGADLEHRLTSVLGFVRQHSKEITPTRVTHALGDVAAAQAVDVQILDGDEAEASNQFGRNLVVKVVTLVGNVFVQAAYLAGQFTIFATTPLAARAAALQNGKFFFRSAEPARIVNVLTCGQRSKGQQTHVYAHGRTDACLRFGVRQLKLEDDVPVAQIIPLEHGHFDLGVIRDSAVLEQPHQTDILDVEPSFFEPDTVTVDIAHRLVPTLALEARVSGFLASFDAAKERPECFVQTAQGLLDRGVIEPGCILIELAQLLELVGLVIVIDADLALLPRHTAFLERSVIELAVNLQDTVKRLALLTIRVKAKLVTQQHLLARLFFNVAADRFSRYVACRADVVTARPQRRQAAVEPIKFFAQLVTSMPLEAVHDLAHRQRWGELSKQVHVVRLNLKRNNVTLERLHLFANQSVQSPRNGVGQNWAAILRTPYQMIRDIVDCVSRSFGLHNLILAQAFAGVKSDSGETGILNMNRTK